MLLQSAPQFISFVLQDSVQITSVSRADLEVDSTSFVVIEAIMAPHCEHCCHEDSLPASNLAHRGPDTPPVIGPAYSREELLSLRPLRDDDSANKTTSPVTIEQEKLQAVKLEQSQDVTGAELQEDDNSTQTTKPSIAVEEENIQEAKSETSQSLTGVEPKGDGTDGESQQVAGKKKKKKKSGGKNKNKGEKETGFEGTSLLPTTTFRMLI